MPRAAETPPDSRAAAWLRRLRSLPVALAAVAVALALSALFPRAAIHDAVTGAPIAEARLHRPLGYVLLSPVSAVLDTLSLLSVRQHVALLLSLIVIFVVVWWFFGRDLINAVSPGRRMVRAFARVGVAVVLLLAVYSAVAVLPRPMAAIETGADIIAVDFHAHTRFSHDGRSNLSVERVRDWHRDAGYAAAYITDHRTFEGARDGWANNPARAGENVVLLPGIEVGWNGEHVNVLDADRFYSGLLTPDNRDIDEQALTLASAIGGGEPILIETLPGDLSRMHAAAGTGTAGVRAIEIIDGAPRGLGQTRRERSRIIQLADSLDLALVAGTDNHGWGRTAPGWTLMFLPGWRSASPEVLSKGITTVLRRGARGSTKVVERYVADTERGWRLPLTLPLVGWGVLRTLSADERIVWMIWLVTIYLAWRIREMRRAGLVEL